MLYYLLSLILIGLDQAVKVWIRSSVALGERLPFLPGLLELTYVKNTGAAFSILTEHTWLLTLISLVVSVVVALALGKDLLPHPMGRLALSLILAGGVGNLIDRALLGFVTDMFATTFMDFPVFNVADICVVIGGVLFVAYALLFGDKEERK